MTFNTPLSGGQKTTLRSKSYQADHNVSLFSNRVVFECQVAVDLSVGVVFAAFTWANALVGAYTDVEVGQTILVSPVDDITQWVWRGRVRKAPDAANIYCNETQANWAPNFYVFVIDTFEVWDRLSRPDITTLPPVQKVDFDEAYHKMAPSILGLQYVYAGSKDSGTLKFRVALNLTGIAVESGASITSWLISPRSGQATLISGSYSSAVATFDLDPSTMSVWGETWFSVKATDSNGNSLTRHCGVKIYDASHPPDLYFKTPDISGDIARGWTCRLPAVAGVDSALPWTLVCLWHEFEEYGGVSGSLGARNNIDFIGYLRKDDPSVSGDLRRTTIGVTTFECIDVAARMANVEMQQLGIFNDTAATWDHINNATPRRALWHCLTTHSTVANLVDVAFDSFLSDDRYIFPDFSTQGGNLLAAFNGIAAQVNAAFEFGPDGTIEVNRDLRHTDATTRTAAPIILDLQATGGPDDDCKVIASSRVYEDRIGIVDANGACFTVPPEYQSRAPGLAQGISQGRTTLANQVLANDTGLNAKAELNQRAGNQYNIENSQETITLELPDGYNFGVPSRAQFYTLEADTNLVGPNGVNRIIYSSSVLWQLEGVQHHIDPAKGTRRVNWTLRRVCAIGLPGYSVVFPPAPTASAVPFGVVPPAFPGLDPLLLPAAGVSVPPPAPTVPKPPNALNVAEWVAAAAYLSPNYPALASPLWTGKTPSDLGAFQVQMVIADLADLSLKSVPACLLASDGTNSAVWYTKNIAQALPTWTKGTSYTGVYTLIRLTQTPGGVMIYGTSTDTTTIDLTTSDGGFVVDPNQAGVSGQWIAGEGWVSTDWFDAPDSAWLRGVSIVKALPSATSSGSSMHYAITKDTSPIADVQALAIGSYLPTPQSYGSVNLSGVSDTSGATFNGGPGSSPATQIQFKNFCSVQLSAGALSGHAVIDSVSYSTGQASVRYSSTYGAAFGSALTLTSSPGAIGGFDVQHGGTVSLAASSQDIQKASTLGGAYSAFLATTGGQPILIEFPWWKLGQGVSGTKNTGSTPDFIYGTGAAIGGETLWAVVGSTPTAVSPKISGTPGVPVGPNCLTTWCGTRVAGLFSFSGTTHLMTGVITNSGTPAIVWTDRGALNATYIRGQYHAASPGPLFMSGPGGSWYSADYGVNVHVRTSAAGAPLGAEPMG